MLPLQSQSHHPHCCTPHGFPRRTMSLECGQIKDVGVVLHVKRPQHLNANYSLQMGGLQYEDVYKQLHGTIMSSIIEREVKIPVDGPFDHNDFL